MSFSVKISTRCYLLNTLLVITVINMKSLSIVTLILKKNKNKIIVAKLFPLQFYDAATVTPKTSLWAGSRLIRSNRLVCTRLADNFR